MERNVRFFEQFEIVTLEIQAKYSEDMSVLDKIDPLKQRLELAEERREKKKKN